MKVSRMHWNRREEPRHRQSGQKMIWRSEQPRSCPGRGLLHDVSVTGLSFVIERGAPPAVGEPISVYWKSWGEQSAYRVVRTVPHQGAGTLVGCRKDPASSGRIAPQPRLDRPRARRVTIRPAPTSPVA